MDDNWLFFPPFLLPPKKRSIRFSPPVITHFILVIKIYLSYLNSCLARLRGDTITKKIFIILFKKLNIGIWIDYKKWFKEMVSQWAKCLKKYKIFWLIEFQNFWDISSLNRILIETTDYHRSPARHRIIIYFLCSVE